MRQRERKSYSLHTELGTGDFLLGLTIAGFFEDLIESSHLLGLLQKQSHGFLESLDCFFLCAAARGNIQFQGVRDIGASLFEDASCELNLYQGGSSRLPATSLIARELRAYDR